MFLLIVNLLFYTNNGCLMHQFDKRITTLYWPNKHHALKR